MQTMERTMLSKMITRLSLAVFLTWSAAACSSATPSVTPTPTDVVVAPTAVVEPPTEPPAPTEIPTLATDQPVSQGTAPADAAQTPAAPPPAAGTGGSAAPEHYKYVSQNHVDGYQVRPNTPIIISWTVQNAGTAGWSADYSLDYFAGVKGQTTSVKLGKVVAPNTSVTVSVNLTTPAYEGNYNTWWKLTNLQGQHFGDVDFSFVVTSTLGKVIPTP
jgi:hypothetical protein